MHVTGPVVAVAGRRVDADGAERPRFAPGDVAAVTRRVRDTLKELRPSELIASAAAGADLIALDEASALSIPVRVLLPFDRARFRASSVGDRGAAWTALYDEVLDRAEAVGCVEVLDTAGKSDDDAYALVTQRIVDAARKADRGAVALCVWDLVSRGAPDQSAAFLRYARQRGLRAVEVTTRDEDELPWDRTVFVAMPFSKKTYETKTESITIDFDDVYRSILKPGIQMSGNADGLPFFPTRADEGFYSGNIDQIMYKRLASSRICLADVTFQNVNVLLEIGTRYKANESGTLIVRQDAKSIPFDMSHMRVFSYDASDVPAARDTIARLLDESARAAVVDSPVRAAIAATPVPSSSAVPGAPAAIAAGSEAVVTALMHEAELALARGAENVALDRYEDVLKRMDDPEVRVRAAALAVRLGRYPDAVRHADAALRIDATNGAAHREKGIALERAQHGTGIASLKKAVDLSPNDYDAWSSLGGALRRSGDLASARQAYEHAVQLSNGDPYPLLNALILKQQAGIAPSALDQVMLRKAERIRRADVDTQPPRDTPWSFFDLSVIQLYLGRGTDAQATLLDGAGFATPAQLASHRNAIAPMASTSADAGWKAAVTFLDELIAEAPKPKP